MPREQPDLLWFARGLDVLTRPKQIYFSRVNTEMDLYQKRPDSGERQNKQGPERDDFVRPEGWYRGTSLTRKRTPLGPYSRPESGVL